MNHAGVCVGALIGGHLSPICCVCTATVDAKAIAELAAKVDVPVFKPREGVKIATTDAEAASSSTGELDTEETTWLAKKTPLRMFPLDFEKVSYYGNLHCKH